MFLEGASSSWKLSYEPNRIPQCLENSLCLSVRNTIMLKALLLPCPGKQADGVRACMCFSVHVDLFIITFHCYFSC